MAEEVMLSVCEAGVLSRDLHVQILDLERGSASILLEMVGEGW